MELYVDLEQLTLQPQPCIPSTALVIAKNHCSNVIKTQIKPYVHCIAVLSLENVPRGDTKKKAVKLGCIRYITFQCCKQCNRSFSCLHINRLLSTFTQIDRRFVLGHYHDNFFFLLFWIKRRLITFHFSPVRFTAPF